MVIKLKKAEELLEENANTILTLVDVVREAQKNAIEVTLEHASNHAECDTGNYSEEIYGWIEYPSVHRNSILNCKEELFKMIK